ncbi:HPr family phosphocarrier protein [Mycoplasmopsis synoviae]
MIVMALGVRTNDHITLEFSGDDETQALEAVEKVMLDNKLV